MQGASFQYKYRRGLLHPLGLSPSINQTTQGVWAQPPLERKLGIGTLEGAQSAESETGQGGRVTLLVGPREPSLL